MTIKRKRSNVEAELEAVRRELADLKDRESALLAELKKTEYREVEVEAGGVTVGALIGLGLEAL